MGSGAPGGMSHFSSAGLDEVRAFEANLAAEHAAMMKAATPRLVRMGLRPAIPIRPRCDAG